jgi:hypothetical protein
VIGSILSTGLYALLPDFGLTNPADALVEGMRISASRLLTAYLLVGAAGSSLALLAASLIFSRRELARVTV